MGWGRTLLLGDIGNRLDIGDVERDVAALRAEIARTSRIDVSQDEATRRLSDENAQVKLVVAALVPQIGFYALFVMVLTGVVQRLLRRPLRRVGRAG